MLEPENARQVRQMSENARQVRQMSSDEIAARFDRLVEHWEGLEAARRALAEFRDNTEEPQPPRGTEFENFADLVMYNNERGQYEERLEDLNKEHAERADEFEVVAEGIKMLLPERYQVRHTYGGSNRALQGTYTIRHDPAKRTSREASKIIVVSQS